MQHVVLVAGEAPGCVLAPDDHVDSGQDELRFRLRQLSDALRQDGLVERDDLRHVRDRVLGQTSHACRQQDVPRRIRPSQITCQRFSYREYNPDANVPHPTALRRVDIPQRASGRIDIPQLTRISAVAQETWVQCGGPSSSAASIPAASKSAFLTPTATGCLTIMKIVSGLRAT